MTSNPSPLPGCTRTILAAIIFVLLGGTQPVSARSVFFTVEGGYTVQSGPDSFKRQWNNGYGGAIGAIFDAGSGIGLLGRIEYQRFPMDASAAIDNWGAVRAVLVSVSTRYAFMEDDDPVRPYLVLGYGTADLSYATANSDRKSRGEFDGGDLRGFFQFGAGLEMATPMNIKVLLETRWVSIQARFGGETVSFYPLTIGLRF